MSKRALLSVFLISFFIHSSLNPDEGSDLWYYYSFGDNGIHPLAFLRLDNGFYVLLKILMSFIDVQTSIALLTSTALIIFIRSIHSLSDYQIPLPYILMLVPMISYLSGIRSFIAVALLLYSWYSLRNNKWILFAITSISSLWFHISVLPALFAVILLERKFKLTLMFIFLGLALTYFLDFSFYVEKFLRYSDNDNDLALTALETSAGRLSYFLQYLWIVPVLLNKKLKARFIWIGILLLHLFSWDALFRTSYYLKPMSLMSLRSLSKSLKFLIIVSFIIQVWVLRDLFL